MSVPLGAITSCEVHAAQGGLRFGIQVWALKGSVLLKWKDGQKDRAFQFPAEDPVLLVANITAAMNSAANAPTTGVRAEVAVGASSPDAALEAPVSAAVEKRATSSD